MIKIISKINAAILLIVFSLLMFMVYNLNLIPNKYLLIIGITSLLIVLLCLFKLLRKKTSFKSRLFFNILSFVLIGIFIYVMTYINATNKFLNDAQAKNYETLTYDVIVNKNKNYRKIKDLNNKKLGYLSEDKHYKLVKSKIKKDIKYQEKKFDNVDSLSNFINISVDDSILLEESHYNILKEEYDNLEKNTKVLKKYKIRVKKQNKKIKEKIKEPFLVYISGIDTYGSINSVSRSDVNIIMAINPRTKKILLVSIPRDYYVKLHNTTGINDKLTHAGIYGIDMSINTINDLLDINIDYYIRINFSTLTKSIDLIDGVDVYSDKTFVSHTNRNIVINEGINHLNGTSALAFARERYAYTEGDRHRGENQQAIITAMIEKMSNKKYIIKYKEILESLNGSFETSISYKKLTDLFKMQIENGITWNIESISLNGTGSMESTYSMGNIKLYVMIPDEKTIQVAQEKINEYLK